MDYTHLYSTRIQKSFDEDHSDILSRIRKAFKYDPNLEIQLINYYKGLVVSFKATVAVIEKKSIELHVDPQQAVAISDEHYTFIRSDLLKHDLVAKAQYINIRRKTVTLDQFCYVEILAERRNHLRLKTLPPIAATFTSAQGTLHGHIIELSTAGTILTTESFEHLETGEKGLLRFDLQDKSNNTSNSVEAPAKLITIIDDTHPPRYIFGLTPDRASEQHISKFLFSRQIEIVRELKEPSHIRTLQ